MKRRLSMISLIFAVILTLSLILSAAYMVRNANHMLCCVHRTSCPVCRQIIACVKQILRAAFLCACVSRCAILLTRIRSSCQSEETDAPKPTLVSLCVKLTD